MNLNKGIHDHGVDDVSGSPVYYRALQVLVNGPFTIVGDEVSTGVIVKPGGTF